FLLLRSARRQLSDLTAPGPYRRHPESGRTLREANALLDPVEVPRLPSNHAIHLSRSDTINRAHYPPGLHGFAVSRQARCNVPPTPHAANPPVCAARKLRLESSAANPALHPQ